MGEASGSGREVDVWRCPGGAGGLILSARHAGGRNGSPGPEGEAAIGSRRTYTARSSIGNAS